MIVRTKAPGKLILLGEYALLEGAPGIVCAVDRFAYVSVKDAPDSFFVLDSPSLKLSGIRFTVHKNGKVNFITPLIEEKLQQLKLQSLITTLIKF